MIPYFLVFGIILLFSLYDISIKSPTVKKIILFFMSILLIVFAGIRWNVGTDWESYLYSFHDVGLSDVGKSGYEFFYDILLRSVAYMSNNYTSMLFVTAVLIVLPTIFILKKYSIYPIFSLFLLFSYSINSSGFGYRQDIAIALTLFSFHFIYQRKLLYFLICVAIATLFHQTAIIFISAYWVYNIQWNRKTFLLVISGVVICFFMVYQLRFIASFYTESAEIKLNIYLENTSETYGGGDPVVLFVRGIANRFFLLLIPLVVIFTSKNPLKEELKKMYNTFVFGFLLFISLGSVAPVFLRFSRYFDIFQILVIPLSFYLVGAKHKVMLLVLLILYASIKFAMVILNDNNIYVPYQIFS